MPPNRLLDLQRSRDPIYQEAAGFVDRYGLERTVADEIYELNQELKIATDEALDSSGLGRISRDQEVFGEVKSEAIQSLMEILGEHADTYLNHADNKWFRND